MNLKNVRFVTFWCASIAGLLGGQRASASIMLTWFSASGFNANTAIMDATLGTTGYLVDDFEYTKPHREAQNSLCHWEGSTS